MTRALPGWSVLRAARAALFPMLLVLLALLAPPSSAAAAALAAPLVLDDRVGSLEAWPAVTTLADPGGRLDIDDVLARNARFAPPQLA